MDATDDNANTRTSTPQTPQQAAAPSAGVNAAASMSNPAGTSPFGPDAASILATEHWSLLGTRSMLWNEAASRITVFLTVLSAAMVALALLADATGFGPQTIAIVLVVLSVVLFLGVATHARLVQVNSDEKQTVLAMNRLRHAYLEIAPGLEPYFTAGHHDDEQGFLTTYQLASPSVLRPRAAFVVATPTVIAIVDAALATAVAALVARVAGAPTAAVVVAGAAAFVAVGGALLRVQRQSMDPLRGTTPRFPTPASTEDSSRTR
jgi:hypothetical protein